MLTQNLTFSSADRQLSMMVVSCILNRCWLTLLMIPKHKMLSDCRPTVNWAMQPTCPKGEIMSLMPYASDPEGLYECIQRSSEFGIPIYVSETGFPTFNDDHMQTVLDRYLKEARPLLIRSYIYLCASDTIVTELQMGGCCAALEEASLFAHKGLFQIVCCFHLGLCSGAITDTSAIVRISAACTADLLIQCMMLMSCMLLM